MSNEEKADLSLLTKSVIGGLNSDREKILDAVDHCFVEAGSKGHTIAGVVLEKYFSSLSKNSDQMMKAIKLLKDIQDEEEDLESLEDFADELYKNEVS